MTEPSSPAWATTRPPTSTNTDRAKRPRRAIRARRRRGTAEPRPAAAARRLVARSQLPRGRADLPDDEPAARRAVARRTREAPPARALRDRSGPQPGVGAREPLDRRTRISTGCSSWDRATAARARTCARGSRARTPSVTATSDRTPPAWRRSSGSSPSPAGSRATARPRHRARSTKAASSATHCCTPSAPRSTTRG